MATCAGTPCAYSKDVVRRLPTSRRRPARVVVRREVSRRRCQKGAVVGGGVVGKELPGGRLQAGWRLARWAQRKNRVKRMESAAVGHVHSGNEGRETVAAPASAAIARTHARSPIHPPRPYAASANHANSCLARPVPQLDCVSYPNDICEALVTPCYFAQICAEIHNQGQYLQVHMLSMPCVACAAPCDRAP